MRQFVVLAHEAPADGDFPLDDLPGAGRLDLLCRCVTASLLTSHDIREDVRTHLVVRDELTVTFDGAALRNLRPDERSTAALLRGALENREEAVGHVPAETSPGVSISRRDAAATIERAAADGPLVWLTEGGEPLANTTPLEDPTFVLSDHREFTDDEVALLESAADRRVSAGPRALHADQAIVVVHNHLDTDGYERY